MKRAPSTPIDLCQLADIRVGQNNWEFYERVRKQTRCFYNTCIVNFSKLVLIVGTPLLDHSFVTTHNINGLS